jgi:hypothetical protein
VTGRRRHADLGTGDDATILAFLRGDQAGGEPAPDATRRTRTTHPVTDPVPRSIRVLADPRWLSDGYARTDNLRSAADEDFRLVISAVLAVDRTAWTATGGFDRDFIGYGGEDWDFAWRAWLSGADFAYQPNAVAWHDGPEAGARPADPKTKNAESLRLAQTVPLPSVRGIGLVYAQPAIVVRYIGPTTGDAADAAVVACVAGLLDGTDAAVWFPRCSSDPSSGRALPPVLRGDPRVYAGDVPGPILDRARFQVWIEQPLRLAAPLHRYCDRGEWSVPGLRIRRTRSLRRNEGAPLGIPVEGMAADVAADFAVHAIPQDISLERWWAGW